MLARTLDKIAKASASFATQTLGLLGHMLVFVLTRMQPNVYHLNGSVRGKLAITEAEVEELKADYELLKQRIDGGFKGFVLPGGHPASSQLHLCRCHHGLYSH